MEPVKGVIAQAVPTRLSDIYSDELVCPRCSESKQLAKIKGCVVCLLCRYKFDCEGF